MENSGIHHISVISRDAKSAYDFYHRILGMRLTLKTVNQDTHSMYHLFFGDETGRAGTEFSVFPMPDSRDHQPGTNGIERVIFYVPSEKALAFWLQRFESWGVKHQPVEDYLGERVLFFEDMEKMKLGLVVAPEEVASMAQPFNFEAIPAEFAIFGMAQVHLRVKDRLATQDILTKKLKFHQLAQGEFKGHPVTQLINHNQWQHQVHLIEDTESSRERLGIGGVHHVAFGVSDTEEMKEVLEYVETLSIGHTGIKDREFFHAAYFREPNKTVIELSTPLINIKEHYTAIEADLDFESIPLTLPRFLEDQRKSIEDSLPY